MADTATEKKEVLAHIRWMVRLDMPKILAIENQSFEFPWSEEDFINCLRQRKIIGMSAEHDDRIVGFMIYKLAKTKICVLNFAVAEKMRRYKIGSQMANKLIAKLSVQRRTRVTLEISETNLVAQLFFRSLDFHAVSVLRDHYSSAPKSEDAYLMVRRIKPQESKIPETEFVQAEPNIFKRIAKAIHLVV